jgi:hypothetical protein
MLSDFSNNPQAGRMFIEALYEGTHKSYQVPYEILAILAKGSMNGRELEEEQIREMIESKVVITKGNRLRINPSIEITRVYKVILKGKPEKHAVEQINPATEWVDYIERIKQTAK